MTRERDREMEALLRAEVPPDHRHGFWDDVRADLGESDGASVISINRYRRRAPWLLAVAAMVVVGAVVGIGALRDDSGEVDVTTDPTVDDADPDPTPDDSSTTLPDGDERGPLMPDGDPIDRGSGTVVGVSPDGRWLYVADEVGDGETGCEGSPRRALFVEPIEGGDRRLAAPAEDLDATTVSELHFDGGGRVATVVQCEGFEARIVAASVGDDGTLSDVGELTLPEPECHDGTVDGISDIDYISRGVLVAATTSWGDGDTVCRNLFSLPDRPSEPTLLDQSDVYLVEAASGGQIVTATIDGEVRLNGGAIHSTSGISDIDVSPDGTVVAIAGPDESVVVPVDGSGSSTFAGEAYAVTMRDARSGAMWVPAGDQTVLAALNLNGDDALTPLADGNTAPTVFFSADGTRLFLTVADDGGANPRVIEQPLSR